MADLGDIGGEQGRKERVPVPLVAVEEELSGKGLPLPHGAVHHEAGEVRQGQERDVLRLPEEGQDLLGPLLLRDRLAADGEGRGFRRRGGGLRRPEAQLLDELAELQPQEEGVCLGRGGLEAVLLRVEGQGGIRHDGSQPVGPAGRVLPLRQLSDGGGLGLDVRELSVEGIDAAVLLDEVHGGLLPDAGDAGDVVGGVPHQGLEVDHVDGVKAVLVPEGLRGHVLGGGLAHPGGDQLHFGMVRDELQGVLVSRHHHAVPVPGLAFAGDGADEVVGLPALQLVAGDAQGVQDLLHHRDLDPELLRHRLAGGLVAHLRLVAEGGGMEVKGDAEGVGLLLLPQAEEGREEAEDRVGIEPIPGGERADAVKRPVEDAVAVDDHELHGMPPFLPAKLDKRPGSADLII